MVSFVANCYSSTTEPSTSGNLGIRSVQSVTTTPSVHALASRSHGRLRTLGTVTSTFKGIGVDPDGEISLNYKVDEHAPTGSIIQSTQVAVCTGINLFHLIFFWH